MLISQIPSVELNEKLINVQESLVEETLYFLSLLVFANIRAALSLVYDKWKSKNILV